jgi:hypothetical protein
VFIFPPLEYDTQAVKTKTVRFNISAFSIILIDGALRRELDLEIATD